MMMHERGLLEEKPAIHLKVPKNITQILEELRSGATDDARWIAFSLLELEDRCLHDISKITDELRNADLHYGVNRRFSFSHDDCTIFVAACSLDTPPYEFYDWLAYRATSEKYKMKTAKCIALGIRSGQSETTCECAIYLDNKWEKDEKLESLVEFTPPMMPVPGTPLPGRNAPCICGSGNKFKKCCLHKIEEYRRNGGFR